MTRDGAIFLFFIFFFCDKLIGFCFCRKTKTKQLIGPPPVVAIPLQPVIKLKIIEDKRTTYHRYSEWAIPFYDSNGQNTTIFEPVILTGFYTSE